MFFLRLVWLAIPVPLDIMISGCLTVEYTIAMLTTKRKLSRRLLAFHICGSSDGNVEGHFDVRRGSLVQIYSVYLFLDYVDESKGIGALLPERSFSKTAADVEEGLLRR